MNLRLSPLVAVALLTLVSCASHKNNEHCMAKIDPLDMSEETLMSTCVVNVLPTTINTDMVVANVPDMTQELVYTLTEKSIDALNSIHHFSVIQSQEALENQDEVNHADYILTSHVEEFILTDDLIETEDGMKDQKHVTTAVTYNLHSSKDNQVIFSNTINMSLLQKTYDPAIIEQSPKFIDLAQHVMDTVARLFKHNFVNEFTPIRIIDINEDGVAILNQPVPIDTSCYVYYPGKFNPSIINNYEDEDGVIKGILKVVETTPNTTYASVMMGYANKNDICRTKFFSEKFGWETIQK